MKLQWPTRWRLTRTDIQQALRLLAACALSYATVSLFRVPEGYWSLVTAVVVMQSDIKDTLAAGRDRIAATLVGAVFGLVLIWLRQRGLPTLPLFAAGLVPLALLTAARPHLRLACTTLVIVFLIPATGDPYGRPLFRILDIIIGSAACIAVSLAVFPEPGRRAA